MTTHIPSVPAEELRSRQAGLQGALAAAGLDGALVVEKTDLFYYSGTSQQGYLYMPVAGEPLLMVFKDYERARAESLLADVIAVNGTSELAVSIGERYPVPARLGMELDVLPVNLFRQYEKIFSGAQIVDISLAIRLQRAVKSPHEVTKLRAAAEGSDRVAVKAKELIREGITEVALAGELEAYARSLGHQGLVRMRMFGNELYWGHLLSGPAAADPSYLASPTGGPGVSAVIGQGASRKKISRNEPILLDYVFALDGYLSDHARIFSLGPLPDELVAAHAAMLDIQEAMKTACVPGAVTGDLYEMMVALAVKKGYGGNFMGATEKRIRFTGHGVGLELDEFPFIAKGQKLELAAGMVIAMEPKVIFPGRGVVGIENCLLVTEKGLETLGSYPDGITVLD